MQQVSCKCPNTPHNRHSCNIFFEGFIKHNTSSIVIFVLITFENNLVHINFGFRLLITWLIFFSFLIGDLNLFWSSLSRLWRRRWCSVSHKSFIDIVFFSCVKAIMISLVDNEKVATPCFQFSFCVEQEAINLHFGKLLSVESLNILDGVPNILKPQFGIFPFGALWHDQVTKHERSTGQHQPK